MKKTLLTILCLVATLIILLSPQTVIEGVRTGIKLNLYSVIPSLLPFMVLTNFMVKYDLCQYISYIFKPVLSKIFKVSSNGCFAVIIGFTCGYPMGAKVIGDLFCRKMISKSEACYLITYCNNCSVTFLLNYIIYECFSAKIPVSVALILIYAPPILTGFINKFIFSPNISLHATLEKSTYNQNPIYAAVKSMSILSVYIICFTVVAKWIETLPMLPLFGKCVIAGLTEITSGTGFIISLIHNNTLRVFLIFACVIFGGFSIMFQSFEQLSEKDLKHYYIIGKLEQLFLYLILFFIIFTFIKI